MQFSGRPESFGGFNDFLPDESFPLESVMKNKDPKMIIMWDRWSVKYVYRFLGKTEEKPENTQRWIFPHLKSLRCLFDSLRSKTSRRSITPAGRKRVEKCKIFLLSLRDSFFLFLVFLFWQKPVWTFESVESTKNTTSTLRDTPIKVKGIIKSVINLDFES